MNENVNDAGRQQVGVARRGRWRSERERKNETTPKSLSLYRLLSSSVNYSTCTRGLCTEKKSMGIG